MGTCSSLRRRMMMSVGEVSLPNYLCFTALEDGNMICTIGDSITTSMCKYISYSLDFGKTWIKTDNVDSTLVTITVPVKNGDIVLWKGVGTATAINANYGNKSKILNFSPTCKFNASGNPLSLLFDRFESLESNNTSYLLASIFAYCTTIISAKDIKLSLKTIGQRGYDWMFYGCTNLLYAPEKCDAISIGDYCLGSMFYNCSNMLTLMDISSIKNVRTYSLSRIFQGCVKVEGEAIVNVTTNKSGLAVGLFQDCKKLKYIRFLVISGSGYSNMCYGITSNDGIFVKHINATWTTTGNNGVPTNWTVIYYDPSEDKYYTSQDKSQECDDHGNPI